MTTVLDENNSLASIRVDSYGRTLTAGAVTGLSHYPAHSDAETRAAWGNFAGVNTAIGDFIAKGPVVNGQASLALSGSPLVTGESFMVYANGMTQPGAVEFALSASRFSGHFMTASVFANGPAGADAPAADIAITSLSQSNATGGASYSAVAGTVVRVTLATPLADVGAASPVFVGDWVNITGFTDSRYNYANLCINWISPDRTVFYAGFSDEQALPSLALPETAGGGAVVSFYNNLSGARAGAAIRFSQSTATSAAFSTLYGANDNQISGTLTGDHRISLGSSTATIGGARQDIDLRASTRYRIEVDKYRTLLMDQSEQSNTTWTIRDTRTTVKPDTDTPLQPRLRLYRPPAMARPLVRIVSAAKTGTTTATVTTDGAHGLVTGNVVNLYGSRDAVTNFPGVAQVSVTVTGANTFTVVWGPAVTATSYGGFVGSGNGGRAQPGIIAQSIVSIAGTHAANDIDDYLTLTGSANWSGISRGDYVNLYGMMTDLTGVATGYDGAYEVVDVFNTTLTVNPIYNFNGVRISPSIPTFGTVNCGGAIIIRPTIRLHDMLLESWSETRVRVDGAGTTRQDKAVPVTVLNTASVNANTTETTLVSPSTYVLNSAATTNAAAVKATAGNVYSIVVSNISATAAFFKLYNKASAPTVGTDVPVITIPVAAGATVTMGFERVGMRFTTGIATATTRLAPVADATAIGAGELQIMVSYI